MGFSKDKGKLARLLTGLAKGIADLGSILSLATSFKRGLWALGRLGTACPPQPGPVVRVKPPRSRCPRNGALDPLLVRKLIHCKILGLAAPCCGGVSVRATATMEYLAGSPDHSSGSGQVNVVTSPARPSARLCLANARPTLSGPGSADRPPCIRHRRLPRTTTASRSSAKNCRTSVEMIETR
jgi:hypothetical protein